MMSPFSLLVASADATLPVGRDRGVQGRKRNLRGLGAAQRAKRVSLGPLIALARAPRGSAPKPFLRAKDRDRMAETQNPALGIHAARALAN